MQTAIALGTFDGLHAGHRAVLSATLPYHSVAVSFAIPPKAVMTGNPQLLMTPTDKVSALKSFGMNEVKLLDFNEIRELSPQQFLDMLCAEFSPSLIACGYNYRFGKNASGDTEFLRRYCKEHSIKFHCAHCVCEGDTPINSTLLRSMIHNGNIELANAQIYGGFGFTSSVLHGDARGRTLGFPTVNQAYPDLLVPVKFGVYAVNVIIDDNCYTGIANIGIRPTWQTENIMSETYIKDFSGDLYGKNITIKPKRFLRPEKRFNSVNELIDAIKNDILSLNNL